MLAAKSYPGVAQITLAQSVPAHGWDYPLLIGTTVLCCLLMLQPLAASIGAAVVYAMSVVCFISPYSGLCLLAASQIVPDPPGAPLTIAQLAFLGFLSSVVYHRYRCRYMQDYLWFVAPLTIWTVFLDLTMRGHVFVPPILAYIIGAAACLLVSHERVRTDLALLAICLGSFCSCLSWWGPQFGLEIAKTELQRAGLERMVAGRLAGVAGFPSALASIGLLAVAFWPGSVCSRGPIRWLLLGMSFAAAVSVPGTLGRGALAALVLGFLVFFCFQRRVPWSPSERSIRHPFQTAVILLFVAALAAFLWRNASTKSYLQATSEFTREEIDRSGGVLGYERVDKIIRMIRLIACYPVTGVPENQVLYTPVGRGTKWALLDYTVPHNVFLGIGFSYGVPGMIIFGLLFFYPPIKILQRNRGIDRAALLACHTVFFTMFMLFPFGNFKTFYLLLAIELCWLRQTAPSRIARIPPARPATV